MESNRIATLRAALVYDAVYPYTLGGVEYRNFALARHFAGRIKVTFYGFGYWIANRATPLPDCAYISIGPPRPLHDASGKRRVGDAIAASIGVATCLWSSDEDVWEVANIPHLPVIAARVVSVLRRKPLVVTWHEFFGEFWGEYLGSRTKGRLAQIIERLALRCTPYAIVVSPLTKSRMIAAGFPASRVALIPNGVDVQAIGELTADTTRASDFVYIGRLAPHKRVDIAIRAFALLRSSRPSLTFRIIGDGPSLRALQALASELGVGDAVAFDGFVNSDIEVFRRMKAAKVAILPSEREGFGLALVQAWACGLPAVVCRGPENAMSTMMAEQFLGEVVDPSPHAISSACERLVSSAGPDGARARREFARLNYDERHVATLIADVLESRSKRR